MTDDDICAVMGWPVTHRAYKGSPGDLIYRLRLLVAAAADQERERCADIVEHAYSRHGCACSDCEALAAVIRGTP